MREIDAATAADYLRDARRVSPGTAVHVCELAGGVSNLVLRVEVAGEPPIVLKQGRERLRVAMDWRARLDRVWTESATMRVLGAILPEGTVPRLLFEDRPNYLFAMTCAPEDAVTWKSRLMAGRVEPDIAGRLGTILGTIHAEAPRHPALHTTLADASLFDELRVDPYYRTIAHRHPDLAPHIDDLIASMNRPDEERTLVLGDFSPKNILVHSGGLILLDFECAHAGDPTFDLGFFLTHLLLKSIRAASADPSGAAGYIKLTREFWDAYLERRNLAPGPRTELVRRAIRHTAACCLARVDGKSPVEYLDAQGQTRARSFARAALEAGPGTWDDLMTMLGTAPNR